MGPIPRSALSGRLSVGHSKRLYVSLSEFLHKQSYILLWFYWYVHLERFAKVQPNTKCFCFFFSTLPVMPGPHPASDGLISYSAPEGQLMMPPGYPIASLNDSTYDGVHERRQVTHALCTHSSFSLLNVCDWRLTGPIGSCLGGWASWRTVWSAWTTSCWHVSTMFGRATTTWAGGTTRWALRDT